MLIRFSIYKRSVATVALPQRHQGESQRSKDKYQNLQFCSFDFHCGFRTRLFSSFMLSIVTFGFLCCLILVNGSDLVPFQFSVEYIREQAKEGGTDQQSQEKRKRKGTSNTSCTG